MISVNNSRDKNTYIKRESTFACVILNYLEHLSCA